MSAAGAARPGRGRAVAPTASLGVALLSGLALADGEGGSPLSAAVNTLNQGTNDVKSVAIAIGLLLSALLAIGVVVMLYMRAGGGK